MTELTIDGPAGPIEAVLEAPAGHSGSHFAVVCHPHPVHGGTMTNKVVYTLARTFQELGVATLRFNFRGVGASAGRFDEGIGELDDALAVIAWGRARWPGARLWLSGFSFGAMIAIRAAQQVSPDRLITVAPPIKRLMSTEAIVPPACPWLIVQGEADDIVDWREVRNWAAQLSPSPALVLLPDVGHFFHGRLRDLQEAVSKEKPGWTALTRVS